MAGFLSMPLFTRILTITEYGLYTSIGATYNFLLAFSKLGIQQAAVRFYPIYKEGKRSGHISTYYSTMVFGSAILSIPVSFIVLVLFYKVFYSNEKILTFPILVMIYTIIVVNSVYSVMMQILSAQEKSISYSVMSAINRYGYLILAFIFSFFFANKLYGVYVGGLINIIILFSILILMWLLQGKIKLKGFSMPLLKDSIKYGFPLVFFELSTVTLCLGDRYIIQYYMGSESVGIYSVGYSIADMSQSILSFPLRLAIIPIYLRIWEKGGKGKTEEFLSAIFNYYFMFGIPIIIGVSWFGNDIITLLATSRYSSANIIIPYIVFPSIVYGALPIYGAGLYIYKKSNTLMYLTLSSSIINIILNIVLIPTMGILGAAIATLVAYLMLSLLVILSSYKYIYVKLNLKQIIKYTCIAVLSIVIVSRLLVTANLVLVKIGIVAVLYFIGVLILDRNVRNKIFPYLLKYWSLIKRIKNIDEVKKWI